MGIKKLKAIIGTVISPDVMYEQGVVIVDDAGKIKYIGNMLPGNLPNDLNVISEGDIIIPGLIDLHCHGDRLHDALEGTESALFSLAVTQARHGVTSFLPTVVTSSWENMLRAIKTAGQLTHVPTGGAEIIGVHAEGPFLSPDYPGAQSKACFLEPTLDRISEMITCSKEALRIITIAPELPGAIEAIKFLSDQHIVAAIGHTGATFDQTLAAIEAGCRYAIHIFNGMRGIEATEPGVAGAVLYDSRVTVELLCDCVHVHPVLMNTIINIKPDQTSLATDLIQMSYFLPHDYGGGYSGEKYLATNTVFLDQAVRNVVNFIGVPLAQAVAMASLIPACVIGLDDRKGSLAVGKDADIVVLDDNLYPKLTMVRGEVVFRCL